MSKKVKFEVLKSQDLTPFQDTTVGQVYEGTLYKTGEAVEDVEADGNTGFVFPEPVLAFVDDLGDICWASIQDRADYFKIIK